MYDPGQVLRYIDGHLAAVLAAAAVACVGGIIQYGEGVRRGFVDRSHAIPLATNMYIFAHDVTYISFYPRWFGPGGHWFNQLFWFFILPFAFLEIVVFAQMIRFSRKDMMPGLSATQAALALAAAQVGFFFLFWFLRSLGPDPLYIVSFTTTIIVSNLFYIPMTMSRGSRRGQSVLLAVGLGLLTWGWSLVMIQLSPAFRSPVWIGLLICNALVPVANLLVLRRFPVFVAALAPVPVARRFFSFTSPKASGGPS
jgi:hypothetical protein